MGYRNKLPRHESDTYFTKLDLARAITQRVAGLIAPPQVVVEPSAGPGAFIVAAREQWPTAHITAVEVREECEPQCLEAGANRFLFEDWEAENPEFGLVNGVPTQPDLILGNPPYFRAEQHIRKALERLREGGHLGFLLRMAFLNSQKRVNSLWDTQPGLRYLLPFAQRPSFVATKKTEHSEYAFYIFEKGYKGNAEILPHLWV